MKIAYAIPALLLTACAPLQITCERVWLDPVTGLYGCERPTETRPAASRGEGSSPSAQPDNPDHPGNPGTDPEPEPEPEEPGVDPEPEKPEPTRPEPEKPEPPKDRE